MRGIGGSGVGQHWTGLGDEARGREDARRDGLGQSGAGVPQGRDERAKSFRDRLDEAVDATGSRTPSPPRDGRAGRHGGEAAGSAVDALAALFRPAHALSGGPAATSEGAAGRAAEPPAPVGAASTADGAARYDDAAPGHDARSRRVLAESDPPSESAASAWLAVAGSGARGEAPRAPEAPGPTDLRAERVAEAVERSLRTELAADTAGPVTVAIPVAPGIDGLAGLAVTLTPDGLDVTLQRAAGAAASETLAVAAQDLVARLRRRFPTGSVRVVEVTEGEVPADGPVGSGRAPA